jgi:hypothetical protein
MKLYYTTLWRDLGKQMRQLCNHNLYDQPFEKRDGPNTCDQISNHI